MFNYIELLGQFIKTDFKLRYKSSYLGILWIVLKPLALFGIIYMIWSNIFKMDPDYKMGLLLGVILMNMFNEAVMMGLGSLMSKAGIILKIKFPREVVVYSSVTVSLIDLFFNMIVFVIFSFFTPINTTFLGFLLFAFCILSLFLLIIGISLFTSVIYVKLRDLHNLTMVLLQLIFWLTPVYYQLKMLPENLQNIVKLNPLTTIIVYARKGLINGPDIRVEDFIQTGIIFLACLIFLCLGLMYFKKRISKLAEFF